MSPARPSPSPVASQSSRYRKTSDARPARAEAGRRTGPRSTVGRRKSGEHREQPLERREIAFVDGRRDRFLHEMIARNDGRIGCAHHRHALLHGNSAVVSQPTAPCLGPGVVGGRIGEEVTNTGVSLRAAAALHRPRKVKMKSALFFAMQSKRPCASNRSPACV